VNVIDRDAIQPFVTKQRIDVESKDAFGALTTLRLEGLPVQPRLNPFRHGQVFTSRSRDFALLFSEPVVCLFLGLELLEIALPFAVDDPRPRDARAPVNVLLALDRDYVL
jgi:hypothetical protein